MKLLFDENLSRRLAKRVEDQFPGSAHGSSEGLLRARDLAIWQFAKVRGFSIVTADADFDELATTMGSPPKVIWLQNCNYRTLTAEKPIRGQAIRISEFLCEPAQAVLVLGHL